MKIPFISFNYDYYWNQFVCGFGWFSTKNPKGVVYWKRLFGILKLNNLKRFDMNIFEGAKFGDKFRTRDGRRAVYLGHNVCWIEGLDNETEYVYDGSFSSMELGIDIVGKWEEPINDVDLMDLSCASFPCDGETDARSFHKGFKAGYHKAKGF